jgi:putative transposase
MKYRMIQRCRTVFPIRLMCRCLRVSSNGYYGWVTRAPSARTQENVRLLTRIRVLHAEQDGVMGSPRIWEDLRYTGERCGRRRWRMKRTGVRPAGTQNHLNRDFSAVAPNTKWVTDITYIRTAEHWLYLCVVLDLYSGLVVGWSMSPQQDRVGRPGGVDGRVATARPHGSHSAFRSGLPIYLGRIPTVSGGASRDL